MSEMLGNQYFMARNYSAAMKELEPCLLNEPANKHLKRKLIICYTQTGRIKEAFRSFQELVNEDINFIIEADPVKDDCPCPELVENVKEIKNDSSRDYYILAGILWLYCDAQKSLDYFNTVLQMNPEDESIISLRKKIFDYIQLTKPA